MEKVFDKIMALLDKMPIGVQVIGLAIISFLILLYRIMLNERVQKALISKLQKRLGNITEKQLHFHRLFDRKEVYQRIIDNMRFDSENKTMVFKIILTAKLDTDIKMSKDFIEKNDFSKIDKHTLCSMMITHINCIVRTYEAKALEELRRNFNNQIGQSLFDFTMNTVGGFREKRADRINRMVFQFDEYLRNSQVFDNNIERVEYFLTEIQYALRNTILEAEKMFANLNGEIDKIVAGKN